MNFCPHFGQYAVRVELDRGGMGGSVTQLMSGSYGGIVGRREIKSKEKGKPTPPASCGRGTPE